MIVCSLLVVLSPEQEEGSCYDTGSIWPRLHYEGAQSVHKDVNTPNLVKTSGYSELKVFPYGNMYT